jgi:hypothetical protein
MATSASRALVGTSMTDPTLLNDPAAPLESQLGQAAAGPTLLSKALPGSPT